MTSTALKNIFNSTQQKIAEVYCGGDFAHISKIKEAENCGDTLFLFLILEAGDASDKTEFIGMLDEAIKQMQDVRAEL
jgi:hypothetical protein